MSVMGSLARNRLGFPLRIVSDSAVRVAAAAPYPRSAHLLTLGRFADAKICSTEIKFYELNGPQMSVYGLHRVPFGNV